ncbi:CHROMATIN MODIFICATION-RELATED PROTEIN EAF1 A-RELATED [Salix koriyanagi]|uniref:CHROMATIN MODIFICATION-RELATED PROTEIN EAF1 A-RELATED n=1 Tax=Salix koriyanagi TaxID=2511006 RepID=A0A9Q0UP53_9ROSI|nr:CHROMATIN MODIFICATION-RELATED PROTEIN EAF1 A-RELATED [Salix koriyanagi]
MVPIPTGKTFTPVVTAALLIRLFKSFPTLCCQRKKSSAALDPQSCSKTHSKLVDKAHEDSVLEEARVIEAKRKRIAELSGGTVPSEIHRKSHWDSVLEEMAWLANDFAQV